MSNFGEVDPAAYLSFLNAVRQGTAAAFENLTLGGNTKLVNPLAGLAFDLEGTDSHQLKIPSFPRLDSAELADQAIELYWMALCRDVNFVKYETDPLAIEATGNYLNWRRSADRNPAASLRPRRCSVDLLPVT
jgi:hypothetical protein